MKAVDHARFVKAQSERYELIIQVLQKSVNVMSEQIDYLKNELEATKQAYQELAEDAEPNE